MVYNERFGREIPQGWSTMPISEILDKYPTTKRYETKEYLSCGKYPIIDQGDSYIVGFTNEVDHLLTRHPAVLFGDHSTKVKFLDFDFARGADGTQILYSSNEAVSQYYLYLAVSALQIPNPGYSRHFKYLKELPIIIPDLKIANTFKNIVKPLFEEWTKNIFCNIELTKQRNELLPLLMNGQVSVNSDLSKCISKIGIVALIRNYPNSLLKYWRLVIIYKCRITFSYNFSSHFASLPSPSQISSTSSDRLLPPRLVGDRPSGGRKWSLRHHWRRWRLEFRI